MFNLLFKSGIIKVENFKNNKTEYKDLQGIIKKKKEQLIIINLLNFQYYFKKFSLIIKYLCSKKLNVFFMKTSGNLDFIFKSFCKSFNFIYLDEKITPNFITNFKIYKQTKINSNLENSSAFKNNSFKFLNKLQTQIKKKKYIDSNIYKLQRSFDAVFFFSTLSSNDSIYKNQITNFNLLTLSLLNVKNSTKNTNYFMPLNTDNFKSIFVLFYLIEYQLKKQILLKNLQI